MTETSTFFHPFELLTHLDDAMTIIFLLFKHILNTEFIIAQQKLN